MMFFRARSLRQKLILVSVLTSGLTLLLMSIAHISMEMVITASDEKKRLGILAQVALEQAAKSPAKTTEDKFNDSLAVLGTDPSIIRACFYDDNRSLVSLYQRNHETDPACKEFLPDLHSAGFFDLSLIFPVYLDDKSAGSLFIEGSYLNQKEYLQRFILFSVTITLSALLISLLLANRFRNIVARPMKDLSETLTEIVGNKNYSIRATKESNDELGKLVDLFNNLLGTIEEENHSLRTSEERFRKLTALSPVGIFQVDPQQQLQYVNQRWRDIHRLTRESPTLHDWFEMIHPGDMVMVQEAWNRMVFEQESISLDLRLVRRDNASTWIHLMAGTLHDKDGILLGYLGAISDISELKAAQIQMETLAFYDPLTGLANRRLFKNRLEKSLKNLSRSDHSMALMFLDMDQFKHINDTQGHDAGDILLKEVVSRINTAVRNTDLVSRIGGDEFTILLSDVKNIQEVKSVAENILRSVSRPIRVKGQEISTSVSIGITMAPGDSDDINTLMKNADLAMYSAKESGRNNYQFFSEDLNHSILQGLALEKELKEAIQRNQFTLLYQPKVSLFDYHPTGVETLIRWNHPEKGLLTPNEFIPVAEETGQIIDIGTWVLEQACRQISSMIRENILPPEAKIAVNLSAKQFSDPNLVTHIVNVLEVTRIPPHALELEITESTLMDDVEAAIDIMRELKSTGVSIAIDDFGTGYSSLSYLKRLPIDVLKVDRSFVMDIPEDENDMAITAAVIAMAHKLGLKVVAEGVETLEQLQFLRQNNCDEGQGFLISRPLSLGQLHQFLLDNGQKVGNSFDR